MVDLEEKVKLFDGEIIMETIRQWIELIMGITLFIWFLICAIRMKETLKSWCVLDTILILSLSGRVLCFLIYEFLFPTRIFTFIADNIYVLVMLLILFTFSNSLRYSRRNESVRSQSFNKSISHAISFHKPVININIHKFASIYVLVACLILFANVIYSIITVQDSFFCEDDTVDSGEEINMMILSIVEFSVGCFNLYFCIMFIKNLNHYSEKPNSSSASINIQIEDNNEVYNQMDQLRSLLEQKKDIQIARKQLSLLGIGGFISSIIRGIVVLFSWYLMKESPNYMCVDNMFLMPLNNWIAFFLFIKMISNLIPTVMLFYVIYFVPNQSGKIKKLEIRNKDIKLSSSDSITSENDADIANIKKYTEDEGFLYNQVERNKSPTLMDRKSYNKFKISNDLDLKGSSSSIRYGSENEEVGPIPQKISRKDQSKSTHLTHGRRKVDDEDDSIVMRGESEQIKFFDKYRNE